MKSFLHLLPGIVLCIAIPFHSFSQCGPGLGPFIIKYDTVIYGTGSSSYTLTMPKFKVPTGVLLSANVSTSINLNFGYTIDNTTGSTQSYRARISRADDITSAVLDPSFIELNSQLSNTLYSSLSPGAHISYGPVNKTYVANDSIVASDTRLFNFIGTDSIEFDYESATTSLVAPAGVSVFPSITDTMRFSISYLYCLTSLLTQDLLFFTATAQDKGQVLLNWRQMNIDNNRIYNLQVSTDGRVFKKITTVKENSSGNYSYNYFHNATSRLYFRIEEKEISGEIKYSEVRIIDPASKDGVHIFPTLYTGGNLHVDLPYLADWMINVYSADGRKIVEEKRKSSSGSSRLSLPTALSNGTYTAEVINLQTQQKNFARIIVQR